MNPITQFIGLLAVIVGVTAGVIVTIVSTVLILPMLMLYMLADDHGSQYMPWNAARSVINAGVDMMTGK